MAARIIGYSFVIYCLALIGLVMVLSHFPRSATPPATESAIATLEPPDFEAISDIPTRKQAFFEFLLPLVEAENQRLVQQRAQLLKIQAKVDAGKRLGTEEHQLIGDWATTYEVAEVPLPEMLDRLDRRINVIPPAMVLAQAAAESAWGTSRFARQAYNYFGQWCFREGCGLVPNRRLAGASHEVAKFDSPRAAVAAYFLNINTHSAYHSLRLLRQQKTRLGEPLRGYELAGKLLSYSERGEEYIEELRAIMRANQLETESGSDPTAASLTGIE